MSKFPIAKLVRFLLVIVVLALAFSAIFLAYQMVETQKEVGSLQGKVAYYQNMTNTLQAQAGSLEAQIIQFQNSPVNVTLTVVSVGPWHAEAYAPPPYTKYINVSLQNLGYRSIGGMTLDFKVEGNTTSIDQFGIYVNSNQGVLHTSESKSLRIQLTASTIDRTQALSHCKLVITLILDKTVLDKKIITIGD